MITELLHPESKHPKWEAVQIKFDEQQIGLQDENDATPKRFAFYRDYKVLIIPKGRSDEASTEATLSTVGVEALPDEIRKGNILYEEGNQLILSYGWSNVDLIKKLRSRRNGEYSFRRVRSHPGKSLQLVIDLPVIDFISTKKSGAAAAKELARKFEKGLGVRIKPLYREGVMSVLQAQSLQAVGK